MDKQAKDNIIQLLLRERVQKLIYDSGINLSDITDFKRLGSILTFIYLGALQDSKECPETSDLLVDERDNLTAETYLFDKGI